MISIADVSNYILPSDYMTAYTLARRRWSRRSRGRRRQTRMRRMRMRKTRRRKTRRRWSRRRGEGATKEVQILFQVQLEPIGWKGFLLCTTWQQFPLKSRKVRANCFEQLKT